MSYLQSCQSADTNDAASATVATAAQGSNSTAHACVVGHVSWVGTASSDLTSVTDNATGGSNTYAIVDAWTVSTVDNVFQATFIAQNIKGASKLTVTGHFSPNASFRRIQADEYGSVAQSGQPNAHHASANDATFSNSTDAVTSGAATTSANGCTIWGLAHNEQSTTLPSAGTGYTGRNSSTYSAGDAYRSEDKVQTTAGSVAATFTSTAGASRHGVAMIALAPIGAVVMSDTLVITEPTLDRAYVETGEDDLTIPDDIGTRWSRRVRVMEDDLTLTDGFIKTVIGGSVTTVKVMTDTLIAIDDIGTHWVYRGRSLGDNLVISDAIVDALTRRRQLEDDLTISDGDIVIRRFNRQLTDTLDVIDGFIKILSGSGVTNVIVMSDALVLVDDLGQRWVYRRAQLSDSITLADALLKNLLHGVVASDAVIVADALVRISRWVRIMEDDEVITDEKIANYIPPSIFDVRVRLGAEKGPRLGIEGGPKLGVERNIRLGGY
jgi:hypothetical protein